MGLRPTHGNESQPFVTPAQAGVHFREELGSRFRGNDVTFDGAKRRISVVEKSRNCGDSSLRSEPVTFFNSAEKWH
jgi:hypothetical protein